MTDKPDTEHERLHSLPIYRAAQPVEALNQHVLMLHSVTIHSPSLEQPLTLNAETPDFNARLLQALDNTHVGSRLNIVGDEAFIWRVHAQVRSAGMQDDEIDMTLSVSGTRTVYCVHCGLSQPGSQQSSLQCSDCKVVLEVREHFSRRLGAYLGVCANADQPYTQLRQ